MRFAEVKQKVGLGRTTIWALERRDEFPKRRQVGKNSVAWVESEIDEWISNRSKPGDRSENANDG